MQQLWKTCIFAFYTVQRDLAIGWLGGQDTWLALAVHAHSAPYVVFLAVITICDYMCMCNYLFIHGKQQVFSKYLSKDLGQIIISEPHFAYMEPRNINGARFIDHCENYMRN